MAVPLFELALVYQDKYFKSSLAVAEPRAERAVSRDICLNLRKKDGLSRPSCILSGAYWLLGYVLQCSQVSFIDGLGTL